MTAKKYLFGRYACKVDIGKVRLNNEDRAIALTNSRGNILLVVCDGMGGQNKGDLAASLAIDKIAEEFRAKESFSGAFFAKRWVANVVRSANSIVYRQALTNEKYNGMGTTMTLVLIVNDYMVVAQAGDSRAYSYRNRNLEQITEDQTYVQYLYRIGEITKEEIETHPKRHVLMNALGIYPSLDLDIKVRPYLGDAILVCSDGLYNNVPYKDLLTIMKGSDTPDQKVNELVSLANANGGSDNIAVAIWEAQE
jgi:protein phosphatase